jgi:hypothetical protein
MLMPAGASMAAGLGLLAVMPALPRDLGAPVRLLLDFAAYAAMYSLAWIAVTGGRRSLAQFAGLARDATAASLAPRPGATEAGRKR